MRIVIVFAIFLNLSFCQTVQVKYGVEFGIFGEVGVANATLSKDENSYEITLDAKATGFTNSLSGKRREFFYSKGKVYNGVLVPDFYKHEVYRTKSGKNRIDRKIFTFNHDEKSVHFVREKGVQNEKIEKVSDEKLGYYARNDLLSLFFNFSKMKIPQNKFSLSAVGAKNENGKIDIIIPQDRQKLRVQKELETQSNPFIVFINQKIFSSSKGELYLSLDKNGYASKAILKDVVFFGDIVASIKEIFVK